MGWFRKSGGDLEISKARRRARVSPSSDLKFWVDSSLYQIGTLVRSGSPEDLKAADEYVAAVHDMVKELRSRESL